MKKYLLLILCIAFLPTSAATVDTTFTTIDIVGDIYRQLLENQEVDYEELQEQLLEIAQHPINLNEATAEQLERLRFLSFDQVDNILLYVHEHPMQSLYELQLIGGLHDYDIDNLLPFVTVNPVNKNDGIAAQDVFRYGKNEILTRVDVRNVESYVGDPVYTHAKYRFNYQDRVQFGFGIQRPTGAPARDMLYAAYIELHRIWRFKTIVAGNFQASFGQGLVVSSPLHMGKSAYVMNAGYQNEGLRKYSSLNGEGLHGIGATLDLGIADVSAWYSLKKANDSTRLHTIGANTTIRYNRLKVGFTILENIYSDSLRYYYANAQYNQNYFRGDNQTVLGANVRWNQGKVDLFAEVAAAQNQRWGWGILAGTRYTPVTSVGFTLLYRYYSPTFDNTLGYAFSETSRINDENGLYLGADISRLRHWRFTAYGDLFRFSGIKYGIPYAPSLGYDAMLNIAYIPNNQWDTNLKFRAREKAKKATYSLRYQFVYHHAGWRLLTQAEANIVTPPSVPLTYGYAITQDVQYTFSQVPLTLQLRLQGFDIRHWDNRIYTYENDVLYASSIPATYGLGGRGYLNLRWQIIRQLALYLRLSETIYARSWQAAHGTSAPTRTDIHLLLRASF